MLRYVYLYICHKLKCIQYNTYYSYYYDIKNDLIKIKNITFLYYILSLLCLKNNSNILNYFSLKKKI